MNYRANPLVAGVETPPIAEARSWIEGRDPDPDLPLIDLSQAVPGYPPDERLTRYLAEQAMRPETSRYTEIEGISELRGRLADHMASFYGGGASADRVCITAGCNQAFHLVASALAQAGDRIILPAPYYFNHRMSLDMLGVEAALLPCREGNGLVPDPEEAAALVDARTRAIVLVSPNNPTGAVYPAAVIEAFFELARRRGIALVLDETYKDFLPADAARPHDLLRRDDWDETLIQLYSFSKAYCLPGYRVGSVLAAPDFIGQLAKVMDCVSICAPHIGQDAANFGLRHLTDWRAAKRALMQDRVEAFQAALEGAQSGYRIVGLGAYFGYLRHPWCDQPAANVAQSLAQQQNLLCLPGSMFGPGQERYLRFAFANVDAGVMPAIADRLARSAAG